MKIYFYIILLLFLFPLFAYQQITLKYPYCKTLVQCRKIIKQQEGSMDNLKRENVQLRSNFTVSEEVSKNHDEWKTAYYSLLEKYNSLVGRWNNLVDKVSGQTNSLSSNTQLTIPKKQLTDAEKSSIENLEDEAVNGFFDLQNEQCSKLYENRHQTPSYSYYYLQTFCRKLDKLLSSTHKQEREANLRLIEDGWANKKFRTNDSGCETLYNERNTDPKTTYYKLFKNCLSGDYSSPKIYCTSKYNSAMGTESIVCE